MNHLHHRPNQMHWDQLSLQAYANYTGSPIFVRDILLDDYLKAMSYFIRYALSPEVDILTLRAAEADVRGQEIVGSLLVSLGLTIGKKMRRDNNWLPMKKLLNNPQVLHQLPEPLPLDKILSDKDRYAKDDPYLNESTQPFPFHPIPLPQFLLNPIPFTDAPLAPQVTVSVYTISTKFCTYLTLTRRSGCSTSPHSTSDCAYKCNVKSPANSCHERDTGEGQSFNVVII